MVSRDNEPNQPRQPLFSSKNKHLKLIPMTKPVDGKELLRRYEVLQPETIGKRN